MWVKASSATSLVARMALATIVGAVVLVTAWPTPAYPRTAPATCSAVPVANDDIPTVVTISSVGGGTSSTGSGEIIRKDGYILTNNHVIANAINVGTVKITLADGATNTASIVGADPLTDLAVLKMNKGSKWPYLKFNTSELKVGQQVMAIGAPLGLSNTMSSGIVSALDRTITVPGPNGQTALLLSAVQTDAAINPGNSGGPLVDCNGNLIGVNSAGASVPSSSGVGSSEGSVGLGFAIPADIAQTISNEIIDTGTVTHSSVGVVALTVSASASEKFGVPQGLFVAGVVPGGPADQAGIQTGDVITQLNGQKNPTTEQLAMLSITEKPGTQIPVKFVRNGTTMSVKVTLGTQPS